MTDIFNIVSGDQDPIKKLIGKIPGFKGYVERGDRRMSDKILRETVAKEYEVQYQRISSLQRDLISNGGLAYIDDLESAAIKVRQFIDRIKTASYGYAGIFDAISFPGSIQRDTPHQRLPDHLTVITSLLGLLEYHKKIFHPEYLLFVL